MLEYFLTMFSSIFAEPIDEDEAQKKRLLKEREAMGDHVTSRV